VAAHVYERGLFIWKTYGIERNQVDPVLMDEYSDDDDMDEDSEEEDQY
jgi:hypothetical protein